MDRQSFMQAQVFAAGLAEELDFRTMGNERKVIAAWLVRDILKTQDDESGRSKAGEQKHHAEAKHGDRSH